MKILIISNIYPSEQLPFAGIFVKNQFEKLGSLLGRDNVDIFFMRRVFTSKLGSILKYIVATLRFIPNLFKRYDIIHVHYFFPLYLHAYLYKLFHRKAKIVVTFHGGDIHNFFKGRLSQGIFSHLAEKIDYSISVGEETSHEINEKLGRANDLIMCAGIDVNVFYPKKIEKSYDFIFVAKFIHRKGTDLMIDAIKELDDHSIRLAFVGSGEYQEAIEALKDRFNVDIHINKTQPELSDLYSASKFFVLPSRHEPFGLVASEAMFCGTPAIVSNVGGLAEQVSHLSNGLIVDELTPEGLANTLKEAMAIGEDQYNSMSKKAEAMTNLYSLDSVCNKTVEVYKKLLVV